MNCLRLNTPWICIPSLLLALACGSSQQEPAASPAASSESPSPEALSATAGADPSGSEAAVGEVSAEAPTGSESARKIEVTLEPKSGSSLSGNATLTETAGGVKVELTVENAKPGAHGAHVHEKGDCSAPDGKSAGEHFNPTSHPHALPTNDARHLGDLGNIEVAADGSGKIEILAAGANLKVGDPNSFLGKAIIVHEKQDDGGQPSGNSGGRIGCGVIQSS